MKHTVTAAAGKKRKRRAKWSHWDGVLRIFKNRCAYCQGKAELTRDHVHPKSKGGAGLDQRNIVPACFPCNKEKGTRSVQEYADWLRANGRGIFFHPRLLARFPVEGIA